VVASGGTSAAAADAGLERMALIARAAMKEDRP
jgi:hypothetical protein